MRSRVLVFGLVLVGASGCDEGRKTPPPQAAQSPSVPKAAGGPPAASTKPAHNPAYLAALKACESSPACHEKGECGGSEHQRCYVRDSADCRASQACAVSGRCHFDASFSGACVAAHAADCLASSACTESGKCSLGRGSCVIDEAACARSPACESETRCVFDNQVAEVGEIRRNTSTCITGAADCQAACASRGNCQLDEASKTCVAADESACKSSELCRREGACTLDTKTKACVAGTSADCQQSELCSRDKRCTLMPGAQICMQARSPCESTCATEGRCERLEGRCVSSQAQHCKNSLACSLQGRCALDQSRGRKGSGECIAPDAAACEASIECKAYGRCTLANGQCISPDEKPTNAYVRISCLRDSKCARHQQCLRNPKGHCETQRQAGLPTP